MQAEAEAEPSDRRDQYLLRTIDRSIDWLLCWLRRLAMQAEAEAEPSDRISVLCLVEQHSVAAEAEPSDRISVLCLVEQHSVAAGVPTGVVAAARHRHMRLCRCLYGQR